MSAGSNALILPSPQLNQIRPVYECNSALTSDMLPHPRHQASRDDLVVYSALSQAPDAGTYPHAARWHSHIKALLGARYTRTRTGSKFLRCTDEGLLIHLAETISFRSPMRRDSAHFADVLQRRECCDATTWQVCKAPRRPYVVCGAVSQAQALA